MKSFGGCEAMPTRARLGRIRAAGSAKYRANAPQLADWLETNIPEGLTVFRTPPAHCLRTTNMLENVNKQIKRRTRVAGLFPHPESALRLVSAVFMEISEDWETGHVYLSMDAE